MATKLHTTAARAHADRRDADAYLVIGSAADGLKAPSAILADSDGMSR